MLADEGAVKGRNVVLLYQEGWGNGQSHLVTVFLWTTPALFLLLPLLRFFFVFRVHDDRHTLRNVRYY